MREALEGSQAVARAVALCKPDVVSAYPITPQTHIVENLSKLVAVWTVLALLLLFSMALTIGFQLLRGYSNLEISQYLISLFYWIFNIKKDFLVLKLRFRPFMTC